jgi:FHS family L-fucose permease-like MFS transporter
MIGRWNGGVNVFKNPCKYCLNSSYRQLHLELLAIYFAEHDVSAFYIYPIWILLFIGVSFVGGKMLEKH